mgnify:CR=1 FL=1
MDSGAIFVGQDHSSRSIFRPSARGRLFYWLFRNFLAPAINQSASGVFIPSPEIRQIVVSEYGIHNDLVHEQPLGVATEIFYPSSESTKRTRTLIRTEYGIRETDVVYIYTGKMTAQKGPALLAQAVHNLHQAGHNIQAFFIGNGDPQVIAQIKSSAGCRHLEAVPAQELGSFYRASDVGVWPREESLSTLDAMACGLPVIVNNTVFAPERRRFAECIYVLDDIQSLKDKMLDLLDHTLRTRIGTANESLVRESLSWKAIAGERCRWYATQIDERLDFGGESGR